MAESCPFHQADRGFYHGLFCLFLFQKWLEHSVKKKRIHVSGQCKSEEKPAAGIEGQIFQILISHEHRDYGYYRN